MFHKPFSPFNPASPTSPLNPASPYPFDSEKGTPVTLTEAQQEKVIAYVGGVAGAVLLVVLVLAIWEGRR